MDRKKIVIAHKYTEQKIIFCTKLTDKNNHYGNRESITNLHVCDEKNSYKVVENVRRIVFHRIRYFHVLECR